MLGFLYGEGESGAPEVGDEKRNQAIEAVHKLFTGFIKKFGTTNCRSLTNCDFSKQEEVDRYMKEEVYKDTCFKQLEYVLAYCLERLNA